MKKQDRAIYITLSAVIDWNLCGFCKYASWRGSSCNDDAEMGCENPIPAIEDIAQWMDSPSLDCWGFKPRLSIQDMADIVGIILANDWDWEKCMWWEEEGQIKVGGLPKKERVVA